KYSLILLILLANTAHAKTWLVGPARPYSAPSAVMNLVAEGDTVLVDSGTYVGDVATWSKNNLVLRCPDGMARFNANGNIAGDKGIWLFYGNNAYVEGFEFYGAAVSFNDGNNGAGIRVQGDGFTCRRCYFHSNQEGILLGNDTTNNHVWIESCIFDSNGVEGTESGGWQHNIYIGGSSSCTIEYCYFHHSMVGHEIKCRANRSYILYNKIIDGPESDGSYSIDIPQGGLAIIMGNIIEKGPMTENSTVIAYGEEWPNFHNPDSEFYFVNNTVVTDRTPTTLFDVAHATKTALIANNIFAGPAHPLTGFSDTMSNTFSTDTSFFHFADPTNYDYHTYGFPGFTNAATLGSVDGFSLTPSMEYVDPEDSISRVGIPEVGAFEYIAGSRSVATNYESVSGYPYPNPFSVTTKIELPSAFKNAGEVQISVYDITGALVRRERTMPSASSIEFDRENLPAGIYYFRIPSANGSSRCEGNFVIAP
ncbi:MAG TPA: T9SS type A sorting domain-containing protein, partial [Candidatus Kapabacteria bacterium]|nr:T9SS type A sorting domain-containing protein [Candidatus Kapabacteria bacterium]